MKRDRVVPRVRHAAEAQVLDAPEPCKMREEVWHVHERVCARQLELVPRRVEGDRAEAKLVLAAAIEVRGAAHAHVRLLTLVHLRKEVGQGEMGFGL